MSSTRLTQVTHDPRRNNPFRLDSHVPGPLRPGVERLLGLDRLARHYEHAASTGDVSGLLARALESMKVKVRVAGRDLARIPEEGPLIIVSNHPFGGIEGMILGVLLKERRQDVKIMANFVLGRIPELRDLFLSVDPFGGRGSVGRNLSSFRSALRWVADGGALAAFPAGEVAHLNPRSRRVEDPEWSPTIAGLVRRAKCPALPIYFTGRNGPLFQTLGLIHPKLRTLMLGRELVAREGSTIEVRIGSPMPFRQLAGYKDDRGMIDCLRSRTEILGQRPPYDTPAVQPRVTPEDARPVVPARPGSVLKEELNRLPAKQRLIPGENESVYVAEAAQIPNLLQEIGRLREISFRSVGEGTGREIDLDRFDRSYMHLFVWNHKAEELVGAYRLGLTDELIRDHGTEGLYTSTLFGYKPKLFEAMGPALELGRSFIRPEYQKSFSGLLLLWKGIGRFVVEYPRYSTLFGPVSISADYQSASQQLIVSFLEQNKFAHDWSRWIRPRTPCKPPRHGAYRLSPGHLQNLEDVSGFIAEIESDRKGVPILLKQYLKLGGRLLGFNVDPDFSDVLDVLIMVDLRRTKPAILGRYMGREGAARFKAAQQDEAKKAAS